MHNIKLHLDNILATENNKFRSIYKLTETEKF